MKRNLAILGIAAAAGAVIGLSSLYTVNEAQQAIVLQFGEPMRVVQTPGLKGKIPFIQEVRILDRRVLDLDPPVEQVILADQKRLDVDAFARYRIAEPLRFYQTAGNEAVAETRLNAIVNSSLRRVLGNVTLLAILSDERARVMSEIKSQVNSEAQRFGIEIVDVRIRRADLPEETSQSIFARMRSEREREASEARAQGQEQAQQIRARAERERTVILAEAQRDSQILRGEGDNQAIRLIGEATSLDASFYAFYRSLEAYRKSISKDDTTMVLSPSSEFFRFFNEPGAAVTGPSVPRATPAPTPAESGQADPGQADPGQADPAPAAPPATEGASPAPAQ